MNSASSINPATSVRSIVANVLWFAETSEFRPSMSIHVIEKPIEI